MTESRVETEAVTTTRRVMLAGAGAVGAAALLAACGTDENDDSLADRGGAATTGSTAGSAAPTTGAPSGGNGTKLGATSDIPQNGGKVFKEQRVVVTQPAKGEFKGFTATCTHNGCTVANVQNGTINCGCHGSRFSIEDGSVKNGPASKPLGAVTIRVNNGAVWLST